MVYRALAASVFRMWSTAGLTPSALSGNPALATRAYNHQGSNQVIRNSIT